MFFIILVVFVVRMNKLCLINLEINSLYLVLAFVGTYNGSVRLVCTHFMRCMKNQSDVVINGKKKRRVVDMLKNVDEKSVKRLCVMDFDYINEFELSSLRFGGVRGIKFVNCISSFLCDALELIDGADNVCFEDCEFSSSDFVGINNLMGKNVEFVRCRFRYNVWIDIWKREEMLHEFDENAVVTCSMKWMDGKVVGIWDIGIWYNRFGKIEGLELMKKLRTLELLNFGDFSFVGNMNGLIRLNLRECVGDNKMFENLVNLNAHLEDLEIIGCSGLRDLGFIVGMKRLRVLYIDSCYNVNSFEVIGCAKELEKLTLRFCLGEADDVGFINCLRKLKMLDIRNTNVNMGKNIWENLGELEELLVNLCLDDGIWKGIGEIGKIGRMKNLLLGECRFAGDIQEKCWRNLMHVISLEKLVIKSCEWVVDELVQGIARLTKLRHLDFHGCVIGGIKCLANLKCLEYLDTGKGIVNEATLRVLDRELKQLCFLRCCVNRKIDRSLFEFVTVISVSNVVDKN